LWFQKCHVDVAESLLVVASVGVQLTTTFASGRQTAMFYDIADISSIVINEAVTMVKRHVSTVFKLPDHL